MSIYDNVDLWDEDLNGWHGNHNIFGELIREINPHKIIEVGAWHGQSTINMAKVLKEDNRDCHITTVDTWLGALEFIGSDSGDRNLRYKNGYPQVYYQFLSNVIHNEVQDYITPLPTTSLIAARWFKKEGITADLIYIDASHDYEDVRSDLEAYWPLLNEGGIIFGDDYNENQWPGVVGAVDEFFAFTTIETIDGFWVIKK
jgi:hypothetical protein